MFIVLGLVLGIGVGFLTSLMRLWHPSLGASLAKFAGLYRDENAHRSQLNWGMLAGWLVSVFVWPFVLPRLLKPRRAIH